MKKQIFSILFMIILIFTINNISYAANATISCNTTAKVGEEITISVNGTGVQWNLSLKVNGTEIAKSSELDNYENNKTISFAGKYTPTSEGTLNITLEGTVTEYSDGSTIKSFEPKTITVKAKETTPETPSEPETPKELQFTKVNETVYVKKTVNLRSNYSSSSKLIATIDVGEALTRIGKSVGTAEGYSWSKILYNGQEVYAISRNLTTEKPETTEETTEETTNEEQPTEETPTEETPAEENPTEEETSKVFGLSKLEIKNSTLSPKFDVETYEYTIGIKEDISSLEIEAVANNENATVEIIGNENLQDGENVITILVTNAETGEVATYQIIVNKNTQKEGVAKVNWLQPSTWGTREKIIVGIIVTLILLIVILIIVKIRLAKREDDDLDLPGADELDRALTEHQELTENEEIETIKQEEKSNADIEKTQEYSEKYSKRKGKHF